MRAFRKINAVRYGTGGIADKGLLLNVGCSNQGQPFSRRVPAESSGLMQELDCFTGFSDVGFLKNVLSFKGRQSVEVVDQDYGLGLHRLQRLLSVFRD
jgi:hypothetical protein